MIKHFLLFSQPPTDIKTDITFLQTNLSFHSIDEFSSLIDTKFEPVFEFDAVHEPKYDSLDDEENYEFADKSNIPHQQSLIEQQI